MSKRDIAGGQPLPGAVEELVYFRFVPEFFIQKVAQGGIKYTVNNSRATFECDVDRRDRHVGILLGNRAKAAEYCRKHDLNMLVSLMMVQSAGKQISDRIVRALVPATQKGVGGNATVGERRAPELLNSEVGSHLRGEAGLKVCVIRLRRSGSMTELHFDYVLPAGASRHCACLGEARYLVVYMALREW